jgi:hypothetical protein
MASHQPCFAGVDIRQVVLTLGAAFVVCACSTPFEAAADGGLGSCVPPTCEGAGPSCRSYDFAGPDCPADWELNVVPPGSATLGCEPGKLQVKADSTFDAYATLWLDCPTNNPNGIHISARIAVVEWDGGTVLKLDIGSAMPFELSATMKPSGNVDFLLCDSSSCPWTHESAPNQEHLFQFDVASSGTTATVDCQTFGTTPPAPLDTSQGASLSFGRADASPIDGTLDDVVVSFR